MFPPEIIDHILSFLQWDHATLKVCAQVHPSISRLVERHLYAHLAVQNINYNREAYLPLDLFKLILDNPNIAKHARSLRIVLFVFSSPFSLVTRIHRLQELEPILPALTQLEASLLSCNRFTPQHTISDFQLSCARSIRPNKSDACLN